MNASECRWESKARRAEADLGTGPAGAAAREPLHCVQGITGFHAGTGFGLHNEVDNDRAKTILSVEGRVLHTAGQQRVCVALPFHHMKLSFATMDPFWARVRAAAP
jgi:hypothetical protein